MTIRTGIITQVLGSVVDVAFIDGAKLPKLFNVLRVNNSHTLEVLQHSGPALVRALAVEGGEGLSKGAEVVDTGNPIMVPVGKEILGRAINSKGEPLDEQGPINSKIQKSLYKENSEISISSVLAGSKRVERLVTGIPIIDLLTPIPKGGKTGIVGPSGTGKTTLLKNLMQSLVKTQESDVCLFLGVGERLPEVSDLYREIKRNPPLMERFAFLLSPMSDFPLSRARVCMNLCTQVEYFRDEQFQNVLLFVDDISRLNQALTEVSSLLGPSTSDMQHPKFLKDDPKLFQERILSNKNGMVTSIQTVDGKVDEALVSPSEFDCCITLNSELSQVGVYPAIDILQSSSKLLRPNIVGEKHYDCATRVIETFQRYEQLDDFVKVLGTHDLIEEDQIVVNRMKKIKKLLAEDGTQNIALEKLVDTILEILKDETTI